MTKLCVEHLGFTFLTHPVHGPSTNRREIRTVSGVKLLDSDPNFDRLQNLAVSCLKAFSQKFYENSFTTFG